MRKTTFTDRLRYAFDNTMSKGTGALIAWLGIISVLFILGMAALAYFSGITVQDDKPDGLDFFDLVWRSLLRTLDPGTMGGDTGRPEFLGAMLLVTLGGIFLVSSLIGILSSGIESKLQDLRKGRSFVIESDHTLVLGWSPSIFTIISELVQANVSRRRACIVILADKDKIEMEDEIRSKISNTRGTRIVCRTGSPLNLTDLEIANPHSARAIIILAPETDDPDTHVIKTILALTNNSNRKMEKYFIVAEIREAKNLEVARMVGRDEVELILSGDLISRITVQACRQSGLSVVYTELLDFGGDEIYFKAEPALTGKTFGETLFAYEDSSVIGVQNQDGKTRLNPPMDTLLAAGDQLIAISEDDDTIKLSGKTEWGIAADAMQSPPVAAPRPERTLILGWNQRGPSILTELDCYVAPGSQTTIVDIDEGIEAKVHTTRNQSLTFRQDDPTDRRVLDSLRVAEFNHIIVLSDSDNFDVQQADARTLITLLHLRDLSERAGKDFAIVSEMLDVRNRELAEVTRADDFIVSNQLVSLLLSQVSENRYLNAVFADLFDPEGSEIYLKPIENYVRIGQPLNFYTIVQAARQRGEVAIGYRLKRNAHDASKSYGVAVNPDKSNPVTFEKGDKVVVLAES